MIKTGKIFILWTAIVFILAAIFYFSGFSSRVEDNDGKDDRDDIIFCTQDAKLCPDGSYVSRMPPRCEFAKCPGENSDEGLFKTSGIVEGRVSIGPLCPVEPCSFEAPNPYLSRELIFTPKGGGRSVNLPFRQKLEQDGSFSAELPEGNYEVTLSNCDFLGCRYALPKTISVTANKTSTLEIDIDTGIR